MRKRLIIKNKKKLRGIKRNRWQLELNKKTEIPLIILGIAWLLLLVIELIWQLTLFLQHTVTVIWIIFIADFILKFFVAPKKGLFLRQNLLTVVSLFIPAFRMFRIFASLRLFRSIGVIRSIRVIRVVSSINRGMRVLGRILERRAFGYVVMLTLMICLVGAAAMFAFEKGTGAFNNYWDALWWTAMLLTTIASEYWPQTAEGKIVTFLLGIYSLGVLGYLTAMLASFFIGQDATDHKEKTENAHSFDEIAHELKTLQEEIRKMNSRTDQTV